MGTHSGQGLGCRALQLENLKVLAIIQCGDFDSSRVYLEGHGHSASRLVMGMAGALDG